MPPFYRKLQEINKAMPLTRGQKGQWTFWRPRGLVPHPHLIPSTLPSGVLWECPDGATVWPPQEQLSPEIPPLPACRGAPLGCAAKWPSSSPIPSEDRVPTHSQHGNPFNSPVHAVFSRGRNSSKWHLIFPDTSHLTPALQGVAIRVPLSQPPPGSHLGRFNYHLWSRDLKPGPGWVQHQSSYLLFEREFMGKSKYLISISLVYHLSIFCLMI